MGHPRMLSDDSYRYHQKSIAEDGAPDFRYLTGRGETPLSWGGSGAGALGLEGRVTEEDYARVFAPGGGVGVQTSRRGIEIVFGTRKSVSILGLVPQFDRWDDAMAIMDAELAANLAYLEGVVRTVGGRRGRSQTRVRTGGLVYASTRHLYSRALDPDIHQHVLLANVVEMADGAGGWKALDSSLIFKHVQAADMCGRVAGAKKAHDLGYTIEPVWDRRDLQRPESERGQKTNWRIFEVPIEADVVFSKRAEAIDRAGKVRGWDDTDRVRNALARTTRPEKRYAEVAELHPRWQSEMDEVGLTKVVAQSTLISGRMTRPPLELTPETVRVAELLGQDSPLTDSKVWCRRDIVVAAGPALFGHDLGLLDSTVQAVLADREAVPLLPRPGASERGWSTATTLAIEGAIAKATARAMEEMAEPGPGVEEAAIDPRLTPGQRAALIGVTSSEHRMDLIVGVAGAGKTTVLSAVREAYEADGWQVIGTATSGQAARNLGIEAGMPAGTIRSMLWKVDHGRLRLDERTVLVLDEAGMVDDRDWLQLLRHAERAGCRLVAVGDHRQLGAVGPGGSFEALQARHPDAVHVLSDNVRQKDLEEREALEQLRAGRVAAAVSWYAGRDRLQVAPTGAEVMDLAVAAWWADTVAGKVTALLAYTRRNVAELNRLARERMVEAGRIDVTREVAGFSPGDRIVVTKGDGHAHVVTSERGTVADVGALNGLPGLVVTLDSGAVRTVTDLDGLALGYAVTTHRAQGMTCDVSHYLAEGARELSYVALSRGREANYAYTVADSIDQAVEDLGVMWRREERDIWVHDSDRVLHGADNIEAARLFEWPKIKPVEIREPEVEQEWEIG